MTKISDDIVKEDFRRLAEAQEEDWEEMMGKDLVNERVGYLVDYWFERWLRLTKDDDDLKAIFALALNKFNIEDVFGMFMLCEKSGDYSQILR